MISGQRPDIIARAAEIDNHVFDPALASESINLLNWLVRFADVEACIRSIVSVIFPIAQHAGLVLCLQNAVTKLREQHEAKLPRCQTS
jgi:hypothetical protein